MKVEDCIIHLKEIFDKSFSERIINYIDKLDNTGKLKNLAVGTNELSRLNLDIRNVMGHHMQINSIENNHQSDVIFSKVIQNIIKPLFLNFSLHFPFYPFGKINQIDLLKYSPGGHYETHCDDSVDIHRAATIIINLNNEYEGGELMFYSGYKKEVLKTISLKKGDVVFFPSNFLFPHKINPITKGTRYSIVAWVE